jgi:hypothetical protein
MKRRLLLKSLSASVGALLVMPAWANNWNLQSVGIQTSFLKLEQANLLAEIVGTIIPEGKIQGAKSLGVPVFIEKMIKDCYEKNAQDDFKKGLENVEMLSNGAYNQSFINLSVPQKEALLKKMEVSTDVKQKEFYGLIKNLTIQGYTTSEYVMVNYLKYEMAPGHYYGCVNV